jgi:hypothetical protein
LGTGGVEEYEIPYTALGVIIGCQDQAFRLARLQFVAYRKGAYHSDVLPIFMFILRILADYLNEPALAPSSASQAEPIMTALFDCWREPDAGSLTELCLAACDFHTHRCRAKGSLLFEFERSSWKYFPIEILLLFKLRQLIGLSNPVLDHPIMNTTLGKLPEREVSFDEIAHGPDDLIYRVRKRMMEDGYDEDAIPNYEYFRT